MEEKSELKYKNYAFWYFQGKLSPEHESELNDYLQDAPSHIQKLVEWENEWANKHSREFETEKALLNLRHKIAMNNSRSRFRRFKWIVGTLSIAAVLCCLVMSYWNLVEIRERQQEVYFTCTAPYGEKSFVTLPDGSEVWLNSGSTLTYGSNFSKKDRTVRMTGECYFEVAKKDDQEFVVQTSTGCNVIVKGTKFNVCAYEEDDFVSTSLYEGKVEVSYGHSSVSLNPGEEYMIDVNDGTVVFSKDKSFEADSWLNGCLSFDGIALKQLLLKLSRRFNVVFDTEELTEEVLAKQLHISINNNEGVEDIMGALQSIMPIDVTYDGERYVLKCSR